LLDRRSGDVLSDRVTLPTAAEEVHLIPDQTGQMQFLAPGLRNDMSRLSTTLTATFAATEWFKRVTISVSFRSVLVDPGLRVVLVCYLAVVLIQDVYGIRRFPISSTTATYRLYRTSQTSLNHSTSCTDPSQSCSSQPESC
jgi:hypothetical protein